MSDLYRSTPKQEVPTREQIAQRAYELYERRGCEDGRDMEDWFAAESELRNQNAPVRPFSSSSSSDRSRTSSVSASRRQSKTRPSFETPNPPNPVDHQTHTSEF